MHSHGQENYRPFSRLNANRMQRNQFKINQSIFINDLLAIENTMRIRKE